MKKITTTKMKYVSKKRLRTLFKARFIDDRKELHLLSLGIGGSVTEKVDGQCFAVKMCDDNKILIKTSRGEYTNSTNEPSHQALLNHMQTEMFLHLMKLKKRYSAFEIEGELIYAPNEYYDDDNTVTLVATKYHRTRMGMLGAVVIRKFVPLSNLSELEVEDAMKALQMFFNIHSSNGFKCYLNDEMIPTEETETVVDIPSNIELEDIPNLLDKLGENTKSLLNGKIDVKGCEVEGYVFYVEGIPYAIINKRWKALKEKYTETYNTIAELYSSFVKAEGVVPFEYIDYWVNKCEKYLNDNSIPRGVRFTKRERIMNMLTKLSKLIEMGDYLRFTNRLLNTIAK